MPPRGNWQGPERRRGEDLWLRLLRWLIVAGWLVLLLALFLLVRARPEVETFFDRYYRVPLRRYWDLELARWLFASMWAGLVLSLAGLLINLRRHRRRDDDWRWSLLFIAGSSLLGILAYLLHF